MESHTLTQDQTLCLVLLLMSFALMISGVWFHALARIERRRTRIDIDYVRRLKRGQKDLICRADEAWEKVHEESKVSDARQSAKHEKFWSEFAAAYGKATGQIFPRPPPEIFSPKVPPKGSA